MDVNQGRVKSVGKKRDQDNCVWVGGPCWPTTTGDLSLHKEEC